MKKSGFLILGLLLVPFFACLPAGMALANVIINEVAWMGSTVEGVDSSKWQYYEWVELSNNGSDTVNLTGWILSIVGKKDITLENTIPANGFYFIERSGYHAFNSVTADLATSFGTGLSNSGATLLLKDASGNTVDTIDASGGWSAGDNTTKQTMQWNGSNWITATATPKATNAVISQTSQETQSASEQNEQTATPQSSEANSDDNTGSSGAVGGSSTPYVPPKNIKADAGGNKTVTAGASVEFRGKAYGLDDKPLDNARYFWAFGDGGSKDGQNITHIYTYPGDYIVFLNVSSGEYAASDRILIKALPNQVFISEIKIGQDGFIELQNKSTSEIDISGMQLKSNNQIFTFPQNSRIRSSSYLVISPGVSNVILAGDRGLVEMFYSGGLKADSFVYEGVLQPGQSFSRSDGNGSSIGQETPGSKNQIVVATVAKISSPPVPENKNPVNKNSVVTVEKTEPLVELQNNPEQADNENNNQVAAAAQIVQPSPAKSNYKIYLLGVLGLAVFAGGAFLLIRRKSGV